ncbi:MAG: DNA repair protein RecN [Paludibacteraceae bacterium]|nr:DNA repair protein RecN [Paludibacteraceae bacterium]
MLQNLHIENYVLIKSLDIDFSRGLSVITGETGSGKSVILGAIHLALGGRAEQKVIREGAHKCIVEATFNIEGYDLEPFFEANDLEYEPQCILRREIADTGKSRLFLNDSPCAVNIVKDLGERLIDIHSQHNNLLLRENSFQLQVIDVMADTAPLMTVYQQDFKHYKTTEKALQELLTLAQQKSADRDYLEFQYKQLAEARLSADEQESLEEERRILEHAGEIQQNLQGISECMHNDAGVLSQLNHAENLLQNLKGMDTELDELSERIRSSVIELKDAADEIRRKSEQIQDDPQRLAEVSERLDTIYSLQQKHRVNTIAKLLDIQIQMEKELNGLDNFDEERAKMERELAEAMKRMTSSSEALSKARASVKKSLEDGLASQLRELGIPNAKIAIDQQPTAPTLSGCDQISFLFSANKSGVLQPVVKIASGGEMARLMLCIKSMMASKTNLPTIIFDEIDTGISGAVAAKTGTILRKMAENTQVICITHLPQIAAKGDLHYRVYKTEESATEANMIQLSENERITEIAKMLSGDKITEAAMQNAQELLGVN